MEAGTCKGGDGSCYLACDLESVSELWVDNLPGRMAKDGSDRGGAFKHGCGSNESGLINMSSWSTDGKCKIHSLG